MALEKIILKHEDVFSKNLDLKITVGDIIDKVNAFDWLDFSEAKNESEFELLILNFFNRFNFKYPKKYDSIIKKSFYFKFLEAVEKIKESIEVVSKSYNVDGGGSDAFNNPLVGKFYYIEYWANKKNIPVNFNEKDFNKRNLFNFDTIIISILSDKLKTLNEYERNKPKQ